jgi:hypothetical protein
VPTYAVTALVVSGGALALVVAGLAVQHAKGVICGVDWCLGRRDDDEDGDDGDGRVA